MNFPLKWETAGVPTGSKPGVLPICGEQEFLADLKRKGYTCEMLIPPTKSNGSHSSLCSALRGSTLTGVSATGTKDKLSR